MREKVYNAIVSYIEKNSYPPSYRELMSIVGLKSTSSIHEHILKLVNEGKIEIGINGEPRTIRVKGLRIVKDEFCEWKSDNQQKFLTALWNSSCGNQRMLQKTADYLYCPHCGRRIKVVE